MLFRLASFNVNGLRSYSKHVVDQNTNINDYIKNKLKATILCVQESRGSKSSLKGFHTLEDYIVFTSVNKQNAGKYGVSTFIKKDFYCCGMEDKIDEFKEFNGQGRFMLTKHGSFSILNCYFPYISETELRSKEDKSKQKVRELLQFYFYVDNFVKKNSDVMVCGDFNAVYNIRDSYIYHQEAVRIFLNSKNCEKENFVELESCNRKKRLKTDDLKVEVETDFVLVQGIEGSKLNPDSILSQNMEVSEEELRPGRFINPISSPTKLPYFFKNQKFLNEYFFELPNREWLYKFIHERGFIDTYRMFSEREKVYSCWNCMLNLRVVNLGTRIDLILVPKKYKKSVLNADIMVNEYGSDHCPVVADLDIEIERKEKNVLTRENNLLSFFKPRN